MTFEELTERLDSLRVRPLTLEIPFRQAGQHVHFYLIEDSRPALIDTGLHSEASERWLRRALAQYGYTPEDIQRVFLTHGHIDHYGNARLFQKLGAEVYLHQADFNKVEPLGVDTRAELHQAYAREFASHGLPGELTRFLDTVLFGDVKFACPLVPRRVEDGDTFQFDRFTLRAVGVPGHTPGCLAYFLGESGVAVSGDHLLMQISPNPLFELNGDGDKFPSLIRYFSSLERVLEEGIELALPAHGPFVTDPRGLAASLSALYERRQGKLFRMLSSPLTAFELVQTYYHRLKGFEAFLAFSEVLGNLEMMAARGEVLAERDGETCRFRRLTDEPVMFPSVG